jgi:hypothetical protein
VDAAVDRGRAAVLGGIDGVVKQFPDVADDLWHVRRYWAIVEDETIRKGPPFGDEVRVASAIHRSVSSVSSDSSDSSVSSFLSTLSLSIFLPVISFVSPHAVAVTSDALLERCAY